VDVAIGSGVGLQRVNLNQVAPRNRDAVVNTVSEYKFSESNSVIQGTQY
jgi:hypothetical protein